MMALDSIEKTLTKLDISQKIALLAGSDFWHTVPIESAQLPRVRTSDGPNGVRGTRFFNGTPSSCFPSSTAMAATWDKALIRQVGEALGDEARAKGAHVLLAPTVNTQRSPLGGRGFESFSEDPLLSGTLAAEYIKGVQSQKVAATIKHFVANDQEFERFSVSSEVSERALREIYLKPFEIAIRDADPWALMTAYNRVNGLHCSENEWLLDTVLRKEWGFKGLVMSDWTGVYSTAEAIRAGLDLEMPGPSPFRGEALGRLPAAQKLNVNDIEDRVRKILELIQRAQESGIPFEASEKAVDTPARRALLRKAAGDSIVLLKNQIGLLPLKTSGDKPMKKIAVIGPNAKVSVPSGGGSASLLPTYTVTALSAIQEKAAQEGIEVEYEIGVNGFKYLPLLDSRVYLDSGENGFTLEFFDHDFKQDPQANPAYTTTSTRTLSFFADGLPPSVPQRTWARLTTTFIPDEDGDWVFGLTVVGKADLYINSEKIIDNSTHQVQGEAFFNAATREEIGHLKNAVKGKKYDLEIQFDSQSSLGGTPFLGKGGIRFGGLKKVYEDEGLIRPVELAKRSDVVIVVAGLNEDWESEGFDRKHMDLPGLTDKLITEVVAANPKTAVVIQSGTPVTMPWADQASTLVHAWYGGNELGHGIADVLFGDVNPNGKLSLTFPRKLSDNPSYLNFPGEDGKVVYGEGIFVGYRYYQKIGLDPLFHFGHGLSYTRFEYSGIELDSESSSDGVFQLTFTVSNIGKVDGSEVAQIYVRPQQAAYARPERELKAFEKVGIKAGESASVSVRLDKHSFAYFHEGEKRWVAEKGDYDVLVASSSADVHLTQTVHLKEAIAWTGLV